MILLAHITGNPNSREAALALAERGLLAELHTTLCWRPGSGLDRWLMERFTRALRRRAFPAEVLCRVRTHPLPELRRLLARGNRWLPASLAASWTSTAANNEAFDLAVARAVQRGAACRAVYGYIDTSLHSFTAAKARGLPCLYELPTLYWRAKKQILTEEAALHPDWAMTLPSEGDDPAEQQRRDEELRLADLIIVPSEMVKQSLALAPALGGRVVVVPYGSPGGRLGEAEQGRRGEAEALQVLYVGNLGQAKGLSYLAEAMAQLPPGIAELTLVGRRVTAQRCEPLERLLSQHRHVDGLPNAEVLRLMREYDVLVLPTLFEGLSLTVLEAMQQGLAVVTTTGSGYAGLITDGQEGYVKPRRDAAALAEALTELQTNRAKLQAMQTAARAMAQRLSAESYREAIGELCRGCERSAGSEGKGIR